MPNEYPDNQTSAFGRRTSPESPVAGDTIRPEVQ